jgi:hypothetical protein
MLIQKGSILSFDIFNFHIIRIPSMNHYSTSPEPIFPVFQYSNCEAKRSRALIVFIEPNGLREDLTSKRSGRGLYGAVEMLYGNIRPGQTSDKAHSGYPFI